MSHSLISRRLWLDDPTVSGAVVTASGKECVSYSYTPYFLLLDHHMVRAFKLGVASSDVCFSNIIKGEL